MADDNTDGAELIGTLRRKKEDAGMFGDPWKAKVVCWIKEGLLHMRPVNTTAGVKESFSLALWSVEATDKDKFTILRTGQQTIRMKADSQAEADLWVNKLRETMGRERRKAAELEHKNALAHAERELELLRQEKEAQRRKKEKEEAESQALREREEAERAERAREVNRLLQEQEALRLERQREMERIDRERKEEERARAEREAHADLERREQARKEAARAAQKDRERQEKEGEWRRRNDEFAEACKAAERGSSSSSGIVPPPPPRTRGSVTKVIEQQQQQQQQQHLLPPAITQTKTAQKENVKIGYPNLPNLGLSGSGPTSGTYGAGKTPVSGGSINTKSLSATSSVESMGMDPRQGSVLEYYRESMQSVTGLKTSEADTWKLVDNQDQSKREGPPQPFPPGLISAAGGASTGALPGVRVKIAHEYSSHPFCAPFVGLHGSLVETGEWKNGRWEGTGWCVEWDGMGGHFIFPTEKTLLTLAAKSLNELPPPADSELNVVRTSEARAGDQVQIARQYVGLPMFMPYVGKTGSLVSKGETGGGGWYVRWPHLGGGLQYFSTGGFGNQFHLEYTQETLRSRATLLKAPKDPSSFDPMGMPSLVQDDSSSLYTSTNTKLYGSSVSNLAASLAPNLSPDPAALVLAMRNQRLISRDDELRLADRIRVRDPRVLLAYRSFCSHLSLELLAAEWVGGKGTGLKLGEEVDERGGSFRSQQGQPLESMPPGQTVPMPLGQTSMPPGQTVPLARPTTGTGTPFNNRTSNNSHNMAPYSAANSPPPFSPHSNSNINPHAQYGLFPVPAHTYSQPYTQASSSSAEVSASLYLQQHKQQQQQSTKMFTHSGSGSNLYSSSITNIKSSSTYAPPTPTNYGRAGQSAYGASSKPSTITHAEVVPGSYPGLPYFIDTVDEDGRHTILARTENGLLHTEWLVDEADFLRFLVEGLLVRREQALDLIPKVLRISDGTGRFDVVAFLERWSTATREVSQASERQASSGEAHGDDLGMYSTAVMAHQAGGPTASPPGTAVVMSYPYSPKGGYNLMSEDERQKLDERLRAIEERFERLEMKEVRAAAPPLPPTTTSSAISKQNAILMGAGPSPRQGSTPPAGGLQYHHHTAADSSKQEDSSKSTNTAAETARMSQADMQADRGTFRPEDFISVSTPAPHTNSNRADTKVDSATQASSPSAMSTQTFSPSAQHVPKLDFERMERERGGARVEMDYRDAMDRLHVASDPTAAPLMMDYRDAMDRLQPYTPVAKDLPAAPLSAPLALPLSSLSRGYGAPLYNYPPTEMPYSPPKSEGGPLSQSARSGHVNGGGDAAVSAEGRLNSVLDWLEASEQQDRRELAQVERELQMQSETSSVYSGMGTDGRSAVDRVNTLAAVVGDDDYQSTSDKPEAAGRAGGRGSFRGKVPKCGLGITLRNPDGQRGRIVKRLKEGGPAHMSGRIKVGDRLLSVDEVLITDDLSGEQLAKLIIGRKGSSCVLRVLRANGGGEEHVTLERFESAEEGKGVAVEFSSGRVKSQRASNRGDSGPVASSIHNNNNNKAHMAPKASQGVQGSRGQGQRMDAKAGDRAPQAGHADEAAGRPQPAGSHKDHGSTAAAPARNWSIGEAQIRSVVEPSFSQTSWQSDVTGLWDGGREAEEQREREAERAKITEREWERERERERERKREEREREREERQREEERERERARARKPSPDPLTQKYSAPTQKYTPPAQRYSEGPRSGSGGNLKKMLADSETDSAASASDAVNAHEDSKHGDAKSSVYPSAAPAPGMRGGFSSQASERGSVMGDVPRDPSTEVLTGREGGQGSGKLCGLGVTFKKSDGKGGMVVKRVKADGSAASSDALRSGDRVLMIGGKALEDIEDAMQLAKLTHGEPGSAVVLRVQRPDGRQHDVVVIRTPHAHD